MMTSRIRRAMAVVCATAVSLVAGQTAFGVDSFWQGDVSSNYGGVAAAAGNWHFLGGTGTLTSPRASVLERAVIGTDDPAGALNCLNAPFGCAVVSSNTAAPGGVVLGARVIDIDDLDQDGSTSDFLYEPGPAAGALVGKLTIQAGGNLAPISTTAAALGVDGRVLVGVHGRGYLTMTGGTLTAPALIVGGENITTNAGTPQELGPSTVDLSGNATLNITGGTTGIANLDRHIKVTGPNVTFNASGRIRFTSDSQLTAAITSATAHSPLNTANNALLGGAVAVEFSGAAATRDPVASLGQTWTLIRSTLSDNAIAGNFSNLGPGGVISVTGLDAAHAAPLGANYRIKKVAVGGTSEVRLSYEQTLVLTVNRDTGQVSVRNPLSGQIAIDSYSITSARGSLLASYNGLGAATPNAGVWVKPSGPGANTANALTEVKEPDFTVPIGNQDAYNLATVPFVSLGTGFSRTAVGNSAANFGFDGEDLIFEFSGPGTGGVLRGQIEYVGTKFENDLVLRVNPNTGQAFLKNDSLLTLKFDGYSILSSTGALNGAGFTGLGGSWQTSPATANALTQTNLTGSTTLAPGAQLAIGDISSTNFTTDAAKNGLSFQFILSEGLTGSGAVGGDYNGNGTVDAADFTVWRDRLNTNFTLTNVNPNALTPGIVDQEDYDYWKAQFGLSAGATPETAFRVGSVVFDATAGAGSGALASAAVPEPGTALLFAVAVGIFGLSSRRRTPNTTVANSVLDTDLVRTGGQAMVHAFKTASFVLLGVALTWVESTPALAVTQGIALVNGDFELPGPVGVKTIAFDETGAPIPGIIPGWTFEGPGVTTFGDGIPGDSGVEGGGNPGNEMILSTKDGKVFQTSAFNLVSIPATQKYRLTFDAHNIFTPTGECQVTARLYYVDAGGNRQTLGTALATPALTDFVNFAIDIVGGSPALTPALGRPIGVEFDTTSAEFNATVDESWGGIDNVILQITGTQRGDFNGDGIVNNADYLILRDSLQEAHTYEAQGELTGDYFVDLDDFRAFKQIFAAVGVGSLDGFSVPEPTSLALLALATAPFAVIRRRRPRLASRSLRVAAAGFLFAALQSTPASAVQLMYEPFDTGSGMYSTFTPGVAPDAPVSAANPLVRLLGQNPSVTPTVFQGGWTDAAGNTPTQFVQTNSLVYRGAPSSGGAVTTVFDNVNDPTLSSGEGRVGRYFGTIPGPNTTGFTAATEGTFYLSFMASFGTVVDELKNTNDGSVLGFRTVEIWPEGGTVGNDSGRFEIGYQGFAGPDAERLPRSARLHFTGPGTNGYQYLTDTTFNEDNNNTHLIVMKMVLSAENNSDTISLFLDPIDSVEPIVPSAVAANINFTMSAISTISVFGNASGIRPVFDELRLGTEYIDVLPALPLPGDTNNDGKVDMLDYQAIISHMNLTGVTLAQGDVTGDGRVTIADYRFWKDLRTDLGPGAGAVGGTVPEPSTAALALLAAIAVFGRRRTS